MQGRLAQQFDALQLSLQHLGLASHAHAVLRQLILDEYGKIGCSSVIQIVHLVEIGQSKIDCFHLIHNVTAEYGDSRIAAFLFGVGPLHPSAAFL